MEKRGEGKARTVEIEAGAAALLVDICQPRGMSPFPMLVDEEGAPERIRKAIEKAQELAGVTPEIKATARNGSIHAILFDTPDQPRIFPLRQGRANGCTITASENAACNRLLRKAVQDKAVPDADAVTEADSPEDEGNHWKEIEAMERGIVEVQSKALSLSSMCRVLFAALSRKDYMTMPEGDPDYIDYANVAEIITAKSYELFSIMESGTVEKIGADALCAREEAAA